MELKEKEFKKNRKGNNMDNSQFIIDAQRLFELFEVQHTLNTITCGENWYVSYMCESTNKRMEYDTAFLVESIEFLDSFDWKHWKYEISDFENAKVELVDLLHFALSITIIRLKMIEDGEVKNIDFTNNIQCDHVEFEGFSQIKTITMRMLKKLFMITDDCGIQDRMIYARYMFEDLFKLMNIMGMSFDDMYDLYIGKNALNYIRLNHGYQKGTYQKIWDGQEDNVFMQRTVKELKEKGHFSFETLKEILENKYLSMKK